MTDRPIRSAGPIGRSAGSEGFAHLVLPGRAALADLDVHPHG